MKPAIEIEFLYLPRSEWPKNIVNKFHAFHVNNGTQNPKCPLCLSARVKNKRGVKRKR